ncbi:hypothetical protein BDR04DRAFT_1097191 [Suillus decipiens]|nr:hypothetical protein BDR04DRAFT_1097191 [Suillus decipiens]
MKFVQIVHLAILAAATVTASVTEVTTENSAETSPDVRCIMAKPGCVLERPSNCPSGAWPAQPWPNGMNRCWMCCSFTSG